MCCILHLLVYISLAVYITKEVYGAVKCKSYYKDGMKNIECKQACAREFTDQPYYITKNLMEPGKALWLGCEDIHPVNSCRRNLRQGSFKNKGKNFTVYTCTCDTEFCNLEPPPCDRLLKQFPDVTNMELCTGPAPESIGTTTAAPSTVQEGRSIGSSSESALLNLMHLGGGPKGCCAKERENLVELKTTLEIFLELLGGCDEDLNELEGKGIEATQATAPVAVDSGPCGALSDDPKKCMDDVNCEYDCVNKRCVAFKSLEFKGGDCPNFCFNPCHCRKAGCAYDASKNECNKIDKICKSMVYFPDGCRRSKKEPSYPRTCPDIYYAYKGALCLNTNENKKTAKEKGRFGKCDIEETIIAVNLGMKDFHLKTLKQFGFGAKELTPTVLDQENITYVYDHDIQFEDPYGVVKGDMTSSGGGGSLTAACQCPKLYGSQIWGDFEKKGGEGKQKGLRGPTYKIPITKDGMYELIIKTIDNQPQYKVGDRWFNVYFNKFWILPEIDILATAKNKYGVDWIVSFKVSDGGTKMQMMGYEDTDIVDGNVPLSFYFGMCATKDEDFHVAAFVVNKFK